MNIKWKELIKKHWPPGKDQLLILLLLGLLLAVAAVPADPGQGGKKKEPDAAIQEMPEAENAEYEKELEQKLEELLGQVEGVGQVRVMLTFEGGKKKNVEKDSTRTAEENHEETVFEEHGSSGRIPYVASETNPRVQGVLVIAQGGESSRVQQEIIEASQALFGIEAHKIKIMKMEGTK